MTLARSGLYNLGDATIAGAVTGQVITEGVDAQNVAQEYLDRLGGMVGCSISANFNAGNGAGTSVKVDVFTTLNQGATWIHVARIAFLNASAEKVLNLSGLTPKTTPAAPAALNDDSCLDGVFGDRWRCSITTVGTFGGNASVSVRLSAR